MAAIIDWYSRNTHKVQKIVDLSFFRLLESDTSVFADLAPIVDYVDVMLLIMKFSKSKPTIASLVSDEQELPTGRARIQISEEALTEARFGKQYVFKNNDFKAFKRLEDAIRRAESAELVDAFEGVFLGLAEDLAPAIVEKMTVLLMDVLTTGSCNFVDPLTGVRFQLAYPDTIATGPNQLLFTDAPVAGTQVNNPAANSLAQLDAHAMAYYNNFGVFPSRIYLRWTNIRDIAAQTSTRLALSQRNGYSIASTDTASLNAVYVEDEQVTDLISQRLRGAEVKLLDAMYSEENEAGVVTDKYFLSDNFYFFGEPGMAERSFVPTPEKMFEKGIYVGAKDIDDAPRIERLAGVGAGIPTVFDSRKLAARRWK
ncbi:hypothetical protein [Chroococcidiopsis sp.]|uniref:hypothetical protein n=1 Tax=Chroococcidiopsis sp. TaxID=3088168 RepID=UPI003F2CB7F6